ncbi:MAG: hypothetical protein KAJ28_11735 [Flavobacteriaceae bacterium]|nr:hypothetical protein [Flavobacteriaceae bacterium]
MKKIFFLLLFVGFCFYASAQKQYTINGETFELKTEVNGTIDLLWNIFDREYRYFVKKDGTITELVNTKGSTKKFQEEYKVTLNNLTKESRLSTEKLKLTLYSLRNFIDKYNASQDANYISTTKETVINTRLLVFGGITNSPFINNPDNIKNPQFGAEIEIFEGNILPRHALFFEIKQVLDNNKFKYSTTQLALGYRFRFINAKAFNLYANVTVGTYNFSKNTFTFINEFDEIITEENTGNAFDAPFIFGVGADFRVSPNSYITITYNELFALLLDNKGNFSTNIALGYKFNL